MSNLLHPGLMLLSGSLLLLVLPDKWIKAVMPAAALCAFVAVFTLREGDGMFLQLLPQLRMQFLAVDRLSWAFVLIFAIGAVLAGLFACHTKNKFEAAAETAYAGSAMGVVLAGDWITMILFWEVMAIAPGWSSYHRVRKLRRRRAFVICSCICWAAISCWWESC